MIWESATNTSKLVQHNSLSNYPGSFLSKIRSMSTATILSVTFLAVAMSELIATNFTAVLVFKLEMNGPEVYSVVS